MDTGMTTGSSELLERVEKLERQVADLAFTNLDLILTLKIILQIRGLDDSILFFGREDERPSARMDRIWDEVMAVIERAVDK